MFWNRGCCESVTGSGARAGERPDPAEVHEALRQQAIILVDVREVREHAARADHVIGAVSLLLFDPTALPVGHRRSLCIAHSAAAPPPPLGQCAGCP